MERAQPDYKRKRTQFEHRLKQLEIGITKAEKDQLDSFADRAALTRAMADQQERILEVRAEIDRVAGVKAPYINSSVIHGSVQRFTKPQLQRDLQIELEKCMGAIADAKRSVQRLDKSRIRAQQTCAKKKQELHDRQAQFVNVRADARRASKIQNLKSKQPRLTPAQRKERQMGCMLAHVELWREYVAERAHAKAVSLRCFDGWTKRYKRAAWHKIRFGDFIEFDESAKKVTGVVGKGGRMLKTAAERRDENILEARAALKDLSALRSSVARLGYSKRQLEEWKQGKRQAYEASELHAAPGDEGLKLTNQHGETFEDEQAPPSGHHVLREDRAGRPTRRKKIFSSERPPAPVTSRRPS